MEMVNSTGLMLAVPGGQEKGNTHQQFGCHDQFRKPDIMATFQQSLDKSPVPIECDRRARRRLRNLDRSRPKPLQGFPRLSPGRIRDLTQA